VSSTLQCSLASAKRCYRGNPSQSPCGFKPGSRGHNFRRIGFFQQLRAVDDPLIPLGYDFLTFLASTVLVVPLFKRAKVSPVLGFLFAGVVLNQLGLFRSVEEIQKLGELGVLFLLFEQGLELTVDRLKALSKYAFGMGFTQMLLCTAAFTSFALPIGHGLGSILLEDIFQAPASLVGIRSVDEAIVIAYALSLSSSAFVLQVLAERGELPTKFGSATLGILLFQDIAVVPFLVLLPQLESNSGSDAVDMKTLVELLPEALSGIAFLGLLLLSGKVILRRVFETVAAADSPETFVAACLLTVTGCSVVTQSMGFSDTLGAFLAGVLLAETNFRTQVEVDIRAVRGILLGLFFVTTGASINLQLLFEEWPVVMGLVVGLIGVKSLLIFLSGPLFGLTRAESARTGLLMSQGGEFAFVLLSLANSLDVLPQELNKLLIIVVVISMALTPVLAQLSEVFGDMWEEDSPDSSPDSFEAPADHAANKEAIVLCGFGQMGQVMANMLDSPLSLSMDNPGFVALELDTACVKAAQSMGFPTYFADTCRPEVLKTIGIERPRAVAVLSYDHHRAITTVSCYRQAFPDVAIYAHANDLWQAAELKRAGASHVVSATTDAAISLGTAILKDKCGSSERDIEFLSNLVRQSLDKRVLELEEAQDKLDQDETMQMHDFQEEITQIFEKSTDSFLSSQDRFQANDTSSSQQDETVSDAKRPSTGPDLIEILGGTPPQANKGGAYEDLGYACGERTTPSDCIDLTIKPVKRR